MRDEVDVDRPTDEDPTATLLRRVLHREADAVQPSPDGLRRIRAEIASRQPGRAARLLRQWTPALAAAAALALVAGAGGLVIRWRAQPPAAAGGAVIATMDQVEASSTPAATVPVYVVGTQGGRKVLFREFRSSSAADEQGKVADAVRLAVATRPLDPDYTTLFVPSAATTVTAAVTPSQITVDISPAPKPADGVTRAEAELAKQQIVWTATAAASVAESAAAPRTPTSAPGYKPPGLRPVSVTLDGRRGASLFGLSQLDRDPSPGLVRQAHLKGVQDPRADVWIGDVTHGQRFSRGHQQITGDAVSRADGVVHLVLYLDGRRYFATQLGLGTSEESQFRAPPKPGERGHWSIDLDLSRTGTYQLLVWTGEGPEPAPADLALVAAAQSAGAGGDGDAPTPASLDEIDSKTFTVV